MGVGGALHTATCLHMNHTLHPENCAIHALTKNI